MNLGILGILGYLLCMCTDGDGWLCSKTCLTLAISRIKLLQNKRDVQLKLMRKEIAQFLQAGQEAIARIRVLFSILLVGIMMLDWFGLILGLILWFIFWAYLLIGGACYTRTKCMGSVWDLGDVLWVCSCTCSYSWKPKVNYDCRSFLLGLHQLFLILSGMTWSLM